LLTGDWKYDVVTLGYPGMVGPDGPEAEPGNLGHGWVGFDFREAFGKPIRIVNDAAMQALGSYVGGRMLFLGLGTGLGTALVADRVIVPLELGCLQFGPEETLADRLGKAGREKYGHDSWLHTLSAAIENLSKATMADYVVLGGGHAMEVEPLPPGVHRGGNADAFTGGFRFWEEDIEPHDRPPSSAWRVVR
jgi:polyphosphate glucokinase